MAIYYIDPHTTTNGTGTWASPWSLSSTTRTGLAANDEIRIKGIALTSLLTATSYTATVTSNYQLTITAGGGLGADWVAGNVGYLPAFDTFFKVYAVATNVISIYTSTSMLPIENWSTTSLTVRRVDTTTYPAGTTGNYNIGSPTALNGITVSDCWTDATTRVTDGSVKTLFNTSNTSTNALYLDYAGTTGALTGWTVNLQNTHAVCGTGTSTGYVITYVNSSGSTYNLGQVHSWGSSGTGLIFGTNVNNATVNITHYFNYYGLGSTNFTGQGNTVNITNFSCYTTELFGSAIGSNSPNNTLNITNFFFNSAANAALFSFNNSAKTTINITGTIDQYGATAATYITSGYGDVTVNIGSSVIYYYNKRGSTKANSWTGFCSYAGGAFVGNKMLLPVVNCSNSWTTSATYNVTTSISQSSYSLSGLPSTVNIEFPTNSLTTNTPNGYNGNVNILVTYKNGTDPKEILGIFGTGLSSTTTSPSFPNVTKDATVYRTAGPSLKSLLTTRNAIYWNTNAKATKTIKIPVTGGVSYTVSGYIRTDNSAYVDNDCRVGIYYNNAELVGQNMTTSCINAWEQFTLTFTPAETCEVVLAWSMYYRTGAKSFWLDDLNIA